MKIFGYTRVSGQSQNDGDGPERQECAIRKFCSTHTLPLLAFHHEAITGKTEALARPVFSGLLAQADVIVVEKMDRLARDLVVSELLLRECRIQKIKVYAADQGLLDMAGDCEEPGRKLIRQILGAVAEFEKSTIVMRMDAARQRIIAKGGRCGGAYPYGHYEGEARIKQLAKDFQKAGNSLTQIAVLLNEGGLKPRFGKKWNKFSVHRIL
jgi:DNA invertase Pin-like site-specific DNA recombinase